MGAEIAKQRGVALIVALLVVALATMIAVMVIARADIEFRRAESLMHGEQAMQYVHGAEQWVMQILFRDRRDTRTDHLGEAWAVDLPPLPVDGGVVMGALLDLTGRFNLTNLVNQDGSADPAHLGQFSRLLDILGLEGQLSTAMILDFIDPDSEASAPDGAEDGLYLTLAPPHRTPNRPLAALSELSLLPRFDQAQLSLLAPHVTTLPVRTPLNVNTLSVPVAMSLADGVREADAIQLVEANKLGGWASIDEFKPLLGSEPDVGIALALASDWFQLTVRVNIGTIDLTMYSLLERLPDGQVRVVARQRTPW